MNKTKNVLLLTASSFLLLALFDGWHYDFFTILRFVVCISTAYVAILAHQEGKVSWVFLLASIAVLFNPFMPVYLSREIWVVIDFVTALILLLSMIYLKLLK